MAQCTILGALLFVIGPTQASMLGETVRKWVFDQKLAPLALTLVFAYLIVHQTVGRRATTAKPREDLKVDSTETSPQILKGVFGDDRSISQRKAA
jgi:hypothetical protein